MRERTALSAVLGLGLSMPLLAPTMATARAVPAARGLAWTIGLLLAGLTCAGTIALRNHFPAALDGVARRRPLRAALWTLLALISLAQLGRLTAFMADPTQTWGSAVPTAAVADHMRMSAYVRAAELSRDGDRNIYDEVHWPAFHEGNDAETPSSVAELGPYVSDPYEYPPTFLLLPRFGLALTNHFLVLRAARFARQAVAFILVALVVSSWIGGRAGLVAGLLVPALVSWVPGLVNLQWGQAHLLTLVLALGALVAFARGRAPLGGVLLAAATAFKLFPGLLVVYLALRRRWRDLAWTVAASAALTLLALAVLGATPFVAFLRYQLPRIGSGAAFSFFADQLSPVAENLSVSGVVFKLGMLGVPHMGLRAASAVGWLYSLALIVVLVRAARQPDGDRLAQAIVWLGLLNLAALRSPLAPSVYVSVGSTWLLVLLAGRIRRASGIALVTVAWLTVAGFPPLAKPVPEILLNLISQSITLGLCIYAVWRPRLGAAALSSAGQRRADLPAFAAR